jgi:CBS domain-containing protein
MFHLPQGAVGLLSNIAYWTRIYEFFGESRMLTARDIMTEGVITILPSCTIQEAIDLLLAENISGLPVVDESNRLVGIVTEFALLAVAYDEHVLGDAVSLHMTTDLLTIDVSDPIRKVADLCIVHRVRRVPVMSNGRLAGLISRRDVLKAVYQSTKRPALAT